MKLFVCLVDYLGDLKDIDSNLAAHREFLKKGYEAGFLLASGPRNPRNGGLIIGRFKDLESVIEFSKQDPFTIKNLAKYNIIEFDPVLRSDLIDAFCRG